MDPTKKASEEISRLVDAAYRNIKQAMEIADEHGLQFRFDISHGMGGTYAGGTDEEKEKRYAEDGYYGTNPDGWMPSSKSC